MGIILFEYLSNFLNFEKFNFDLPFIPEDKIHYLSLDNFSWSDFNNKLKKFSEVDLQQIGINGKKWVLKNYSPEKMATLFLSKI